MRDAGCGMREERSGANLIMTRISHPVSLIPHPASPFPLPRCPA